MRILLIYIMFLSSGIAISQTKLDDNFKLEVAKASKQLSIKKPMELDPVMVNASVVWNQSRDQLAVIVKASILIGWHIYASVPKTQPYIQYNMVLEAPEGLEAITKWETPTPYPYEQGIYIYKGDPVFIRFFKVKETLKDNIKAGLFYQTCNISQCLRPNQKIIELTL